MANASSLNTLYSLINGPNADRIGGFIYNAQVDDAARQRETSRIADANLALGNKQAEYSLASALSRSPETAAMFQPGREILAPDAYDMASSLMGNVPKMQDAEIANKQAGAAYHLSAAKNMERLAAGGGGGSGDKGITVYQQAMLDMEGRKLDQTATERLDKLAVDIRTKAAIDASRYASLAEKQALLDKPAAAQNLARAQAIQAKAEQEIEQLYTRRSSGNAAPQSPQSVQPTAAPQAKASQYKPATPDIIAAAKAAIPKKGADAVRQMFQSMGHDPAELDK